MLRKLTLYRSPRWNCCGRILGGDGVRNLLRNPDRLPQVTAELDRKLGL